MRLAVIALLRGWPPEALHWLRRASDAGQTNAAGLFNYPHRLQAAAELACGYGRHYQCFSSKLSVAMFFYQLAASHGHAEAAYRLAVIHQAKKEERPADSLLGPAVADGPLPVTVELVTDDPFTQLPRDLDTVLRLCLINEVDGPTAEPPAFSTLDSVGSTIRTQVDGQIFQTIRQRLGTVSAPLPSRPRS